MEPLPGASEEFRQHWPLMLGIPSAIVAAVGTMGCVYAGLWRMAKRRRELTT